MIRVTSYEWGHEGLYKNYEGRLVNGWISDKANSAGGVSVKFSVCNYGTKTVKSYTIFFAPYNGANEPVRCTTTDLCIKGVSNHDQIGPNADQTNKIFENAWYNNSIRSVSIVRIDVTYTDGTTETCKGNYRPTEEEQKERDKATQLGPLGSFILVIVLLAIGFIFFWLLSGDPIVG